jgi:hypothetical protein
LAAEQKGFLVVRVDDIRTKSVDNPMKTWSEAEEGQLLTV